VERAAPQRVTRRTVIALGGAVITAAAAGLYWYTGRIRSLAVLPLEDRSPDRHEEFFADVMTAELASHLARMGNWRITASTSVMQHRGSVKNVPEIARELGVDALVVGTVQRDGARLKVTVQVIDGGNGSLIWGDSFEREVQDVFALQNGISFAVAREVGFALAPEVNQNLTAAARPVPPAAFDEYVRGRHALGKRSEGDLRDAVRHFQAARDISESTYAAAWTGLADAYGQLGYGSYDAPRDTFPLAHAAATNALELDDTLSEAHASLGYALMYYDWKFSEAETQFRRAIELNPSNAVAHQWLAYLFTAQERPVGDAVDAIARAKELDPLSTAIRTDQAFMYHYYDRNTDALQAVEEALEVDPQNQNPLAWFWRGRILTSEDKYEDADAALQKIGPLKSWTPAMSALGFLCGKMGRRREAANLLGQLDALAKSGRYASSYAIAVIHAGLDDRPRALSALEAAFNEKSHWLVWLKRDPRWDEIRDDDRFKRLVRAVGLPA
jgi:TolB-like protein/tetratricopeptide (TPR) repeat protein